MRAAGQLDRASPQLNSAASLKSSSMLLPDQTRRLALRSFTHPRRRGEGTPPAARGGETPGKKTTPGPRPGGQRGCRGALEAALRRPRRSGRGWHWPARTKDGRESKAVLGHINLRSRPEPAIQSTAAGDRANIVLQTFREDEEANPYRLNRKRSSVPSVHTA